MAEPLLLGAYHRAVLGSLRKLSWVKDADTYPEKITQLVTPAVYLSVEGWDPAATSAGQTNVSLSASLYVVIDRSSDIEEKPDIYVRAAAADITQWIEGQQFGLPHIEPAIFMGASEDNFDPNMDDYLVWRISYEQLAAFGADPTAITRALIKKAYLGVVPDVGEEHVADYRLIYQANIEALEQDGATAR